MGQAAKKWKICSEGACMIILLRKKYYTRNLMLQTYVLNSTSLMRLASLLSKSPFAINNRRAFHLGALLMFWYFWAWMSSWLIKLEAETNGWIFSRLCLLLLLKKGIIPLFGLYVGRFWSMLKVFEEFLLEAITVGLPINNSPQKFPLVGKA